MPISHVRRASLGVMAGVLRGVCGVSDTYKKVRVLTVEAAEPPTISRIEEPMTAVATRTQADPAHFLKIASDGAGLATHEQLWRWLQGDVQQWLSHEVMLIGWGDFRTGDLQYDIVSSLPGMRSHDWTVAGIAPIISYFRDCWAAAQQQPTQLDASVCAQLVRGAGDRKSVV